MDALIKLAPVACQLLDDTQHAWRQGIGARRKDGGQFRAQEADTLAHGDPAFQHEGAKSGCCCRCVAIPAARAPDAAPADPVAPRSWSPRTSSSGAARLRQSLRPRLRRSSVPCCRGGHIWPASTWHRDQAMRVCGSDDVRRRRLPCRSGKAVYWRAALPLADARLQCHTVTVLYGLAALPLGHATTFAAARWRRAHRGPRRGTSSCRYRCRSRPSRYWVSETWRAPCLWRPSWQIRLLAGQEHGRTIPLTEMWAERTDGHPSSRSGGCLT